MPSAGHTLYPDVLFFSHGSVVSGKKNGGGGAEHCECVLLLILSVKKENSPEGPCHKQKEFMKTTEMDGRVRTRELDPEDLESREGLREKIQV